MSESLTAQVAFKGRKKFDAALLCLIGILLIGDFDYLTGYQISLLVFYVLPVGYAAILVGPYSGYFCCRYGQR